LWVAQAALLALAVQRLADGGGVAAVLWPAVAVAALGVVRASAEAWGARWVYERARGCVSALRAEVAEALASRSPLDRDRPASGLAASALGEQAEAVVPWLARYQPARWRAMVVPPVMALAVAAHSWLAALILVLSLPLIPLAMALVGWRAKAASEAQLVALGDMNALLLDRLRGLSTLRALDAVDLTARRLRTAAEALRVRTMRVLRIAFLSSAALELFSALAVALVAVYVGFHLLGQIEGGAWRGRLGLGEGLFILLLAPAYFEPLRELAAVWHDRAAGEAAVGLLRALGQEGRRLPGALDEAMAPAVPAAAPPEVRLRAVAYAPPGEAPLFTGLDLAVEPGEHVAIVGPSGAGKSTVLALVAGLALPQAGEVRIGGVPMDALHAPGLRRRVAWIGQRPHVFAGTVRDNVAMGQPGVGREAVVRALREAALEAVAQARPDGGLGEGGLGLSGGERVRLALARALARPGADLWLADEPTVHLDPVTAAQVAEALVHHARGRTLIVATHDMALARRMHRVVELRDGQALPWPVRGEGERRVA
jgi:ATP-binding cassette subfamily C protein CydD